MLVCMCISAPLLKVLQHQMDVQSACRHLTHLLDVKPLNREHTRHKLIGTSTVFDPSQMVGMGCFLIFGDLELGRIPCRLSLG